MKKLRKPKDPPALLQLIVNFILPVIILNRFSAESSLGPTKSFLLALAFPVLFELHSLLKRRKASVLSLLAIGGILVTGAISVLGLSEEWLAVRRSVPYFAVGLVILVSTRLKRPLLNLLLQNVFNMGKVTELARKKKTLPELERKIMAASYVLASLFFVVAFASYFLTRIIIDGPADTADFNQDYARLRVLSLPIVTLPMFVGITVIVLRVMQVMEKATGLDAERLMKKPKLQK